MPYALPKGVPALQSPAITRRRMLATLAGSIVATATGTYLVCRGRSVVASGGPSQDGRVPEPYRPDGPIDPDVAWALDLAAGPIGDLRRHHSMYLSVVERRPQVGALWRGAERLVDEALAADQDALRIAKRLSVTFKMGRTPPEFASLGNRIAERLRRVQGGR